jgi:hypothetical protein
MKSPYFKRVPLIADGDNRNISTFLGSGRNMYNAASGGSIVPANVTRESSIKKQKSKIGTRSLTCWFTRKKIKLLLVLEKDVSLRYHLIIIKITIMARPIADTPVLRGKDAVRFVEAMENVKSSFSDHKKDEMKRTYEWFKSISTFPL